MSQAPLTWTSLDHLLLLVQHAAPTADSMADGRRQLRKMRADGRPFGVMVVIDSKVPMPNSEGRGLITDFLNEAKTVASGTAVVLRGEGFWAAAMRGVATAIATAARAEMKVFPDPRAALGYLDGVTAADLPDAGTLQVELDRQLARS